MSDTEKNTVRVSRAKISITKDERDLLVKGLGCIGADQSHDAYKLIKRLKAL